MGLFLKLIKVKLTVLHPVMSAVVVLLAFPTVVLVWGVWAVGLIARTMAGPAQRPATPPTVDLRGDQISVRRLLGEGAPGFIDAVFEGGGVKAIAQVGAVKAAEDLGLQWSLLGGTSGGAIVSSLLVSGKNSREIWDILIGTGLHSLVNVWYLPAVPWLQRRLYLVIPLLPNLFLTKGLVSGRTFLQVMRRNLQKDGRQLLFKDAWNPEQEEDPSGPRYRLKMVATDISRGTPVIFPDDLPYYWEPWERAREVLGTSVNDIHELKPDDARDYWPIAESVRMSMSIPFFFEPVSLHQNIDPSNGKATNSKMGRKGKKLLIVDGGVSSNFPIWLFDTLDRTPAWPTFGFLLDENKVTSGQPVLSVGNLVELAASVVSTGLGAMDKRLNEHDQYRTARLRTLRVNTTEFGLSPQGQGRLYESGFEDAAEFFERFDWEDYLRRFRR